VRYPAQDLQRFRQNYGAAIFVKRICRGRIPFILIASVCSDLHQCQFVPTNLPVHGSRSLTSGLIFPWRVKPMRWRSENVPAGGHARQGLVPPRIWKILIIKSRKSRFVVPKIHLRGRTGHKKIDRTLGSWRKVRHVNALAKIVGDSLGA